MKAFIPEGWGNILKATLGGVDLRDQPNRQERLEGGMAKGEGPEVLIKGSMRLGGRLSEMRG